MKTATNVTVSRKRTRIIVTITKKKAPPKDNIWKILNVHTVMSYETLYNNLKNANIPCRDYDEFIIDTYDLLYSDNFPMKDMVNYVNFQSNLEKMRVMFGK